MLCRSVNLIRFHNLQAIVILGPLLYYVAFTPSPPIAGIIDTLIGAKGPMDDSLRRMWTPSLSASQEVYHVRTTLFPSMLEKKPERARAVGDDDDSAMMKGENLVVVPQITLAVVSRLVVMSSHPLPLSVEELQVTFCCKLGLIIINTYFQRLGEDIGKIS